MKPNNEQIKESWEWCGLEYTAPYWVEVDGVVAFYGESKPEYLGSINLNNLFKYAVPKAVEELRIRPDVRHIHNAYGKLFNMWLEKMFYTNYKDPALALFWALWQVKEKEGV